MERYLSLNTYLRQRFGQKVYKLALDGGMTCPNRDGTVGTGGCIFCSAGGSGDFAESRCAGSVTEQIDRAVARIRQKTDAEKYIAYFQSYTNTYAPAEYLRKIFTEAIRHPQVAVLSIATRPDCLPDEVLALLEELNREKPVWVELGLQTIHAESAKYIRRGYDLPCFEEATEKLRNIGIETIVHVILGLPGESKEDMVETAKYLAHRDIQGIKLQLLHVLEGTDLAKDFDKGLFEAMSLEDYMDALFACLEVLPPEMVIHRITGDGPKKILLAPQWSGNKKLVLNTIRGELERRDIRQGKHYG